MPCTTRGLVYTMQITCWYFCLLHTLDAYTPRGLPRSRLHQASNVWNILTSSDELGLNLINLRSSLRHCSSLKSIPKCLTRLLIQSAGLR